MPDNMTRLVGLWDCVYALIDGKSVRAYLLFLGLKHDADFCVIGWIDEHGAICDKAFWLSRLVTTHSNPPIPTELKRWAIACHQK